VSDEEYDDDIDGGSDSAHGIGGASSGHPRGRHPHRPGRGGEDGRQKDLEEALLLQMDMQKRLHEQLEVLLPSDSPHNLSVIHEMTKGGCCASRTPPPQSAHWYLLSPFRLYS